MVTIKLKVITPLKEYTSMSQELSDREYQDFLNMVKRVQESDYFSVNLENGVQVILLSLIHI
jgi:hypothetical protein